MTLANPPPLYSTNGADSPWTILGSEKWCRNGADDGTHLGGSKASNSATYSGLDACKAKCAGDGNCKYFGIITASGWCEFWQSSGDCENNLNNAAGHVLYKKECTATLVWAGGTIGTVVDSCLLLPGKPLDS